MGQFCFLNTSTTSYCYCYCLSLSLSTAQFLDLPVLTVRHVSLPAKEYRPRGAEWDLRVGSTISMYVIVAMLTSTIFQLNLHSLLDSRLLPSDYTELPPWLC